jgi:hypothetical protein
VGTGCGPDKAKFCRRENRIFQVSRLSDISFFIKKFLLWSSAPGFEKGYDMVKTNEIKAKSKHLPLGQQ